MKTICLTLLEQDRKRNGLASGAVNPSMSKGRGAHDTRAHFRDRGVEATFFYGVHAEPVGIRTIHPYEVDAPGSGFNMGAGPTGCWLAHRMAWAAAILMEDEETFFFIEDDAIFPVDWKSRLDEAIADAPKSWDMIFAGSCCTADKPKTRVRGNLWHVRYPVCLHGYLVRRKALLPLIETTDKARCYAPIDISLVFHTLPELEVFTILPRLLEQYATELAP